MGLSIYFKRYFSFHIKKKNHWDLILTAIHLHPALKIVDFWRTLTLAIHIHRTSLHLSVSSDSSNILCYSRHKSSLPSLSLRLSILQYQCYSKSKFSVTLSNCPSLVCLHNIMFDFVTLLNSFISSKRNSFVKYLDFYLEDNVLYRHNFISSFCLQPTTVLVTTCNTV